MATLCAGLVLGVRLGADSWLAETTFLSIWAASLVAVLALLRRGRGGLPLSLALTGALALWALPPGGTRGAALGLLLALGFTAVAAWRLKEEKLPAASTFGLAFCLALGAQLLLRPALLAPASWSSAVWSWEAGLGLLAFPLAVALIAAPASFLHGPRALAVAVGSAILLGPGFDSAATAALVSLGATHFALNRLRPPVLRLIAGAIVLATLAWQTRAGLLGLGAGLALGGPSLGSVPASALGLGLALAAPLRSWGDALAMLAVIPILLPALPWAGRRAGPKVVATACLAVGAARSAPELSGMAAVVALGALAIGEDHLESGLQWAWTTLLFGGTAVLAAYPWLRGAALADFLGILGGGLSWATALIVTGLGALLVALQRRLQAAQPAGIAPLLTAGGVAASAAVAALLALPAPGLQLFAGGGLTLSRQHPDRRAEVELPRVRELVVDSHLAHSLEVPAGTEVARFLVEAQDGTWQELPVLSGRDTGEWAAGRPDVASRPGLQVPEPYLSLLDATGAFFAQRYRCRLRLDEPTAVRRLELRLDSELPPEVTFTLHGLELRP